MILGEGGIGPEDPREIARRKLRTPISKGARSAASRFPAASEPASRPRWTASSPRSAGSLHGSAARDRGPDSLAHGSARAPPAGDRRGRSGDEPRFAREWKALAHRWSFDAVNDLIDRHNRFYPAESRLPMDPRRGDFVLVNGKPYDLRPLDADWILERYPVELAAEATAA